MHKGQPRIRGIHQRYVIKRCPSGYGHVNFIGNDLTNRHIRTGGVDKIRGNNLLTKRGDEAKVNCWVIGCARGVRDYVVWKCNIRTGRQINNPQCWDSQWVEPLRYSFRLATH